MSILIENDVIQDVSDQSLRAVDTREIDVGGRLLMPGLIDAHVHAYACDVDVKNIDRAGVPYRTAHAARMLGFALNCGFTTVRDVGGADFSLWRAVEDGLILSPRLFYAGRALSMSGGHGDFRQMSEPHMPELCSCGVVNSLCVVADGVDECIKTAREELRSGAHCIKIMGSGGVASPTDPIWMHQYRDDEIQAIVNETTQRRSYTSAHCHPASAIRRCVELGVRCIEHGTLIDEDTARFVAEQRAFVVPTMATIFALAELGPALGLAPQSQNKVQAIFKQAIASLEIMRKLQVRVGFGTDLLGSTFVQQCREFSLRREVFSPLEILRQATSVNAEILMQENRLGCIKPGAYADLLVVDGDPLQDIELLAADGKNLRFIMRGGKVIKNDLQ